MVEVVEVKTASHPGGHAEKVALGVQEEQDDEVEMGKVTVASRPCTERLGASQDEK